MNRCAHDEEAVVSSIQEQVLSFSSINIRDCYRLGSRLLIDQGVADRGPIRYQYRDIDDDDVPGYLIRSPRYMWIRVDSIEERGDVFWNTMLENIVQV